MKTSPPPPRISQRPGFLFDADCGVCQQGTDAIRKHVDPPVDIVPWQSVDLAEWGIPDSAVHEGPVFVDVDGRYLIGPLGMGSMLRRSGAPDRFVGAFLLAPGMRQLMRRIGPWMYRHKDRLPGATPACSVPS